MKNNMMNDDDNYKLGIFYFNKEDNIFVKKRSGFGYTLNYGRVESWFIQLIAILLIIYLLFL